MEALALSTHFIVNFICCYFKTLQHLSTMYKERVVDVPSLILFIEGVLQLQAKGTIDCDKLGLEVILSDLAKLANIVSSQEFKVRATIYSVILHRISASSFCTSSSLPERNLY